MPFVNREVTGIIIILATVYISDVRVFYSEIAAIDEDLWFADSGASKYRRKYFTKLNAFSESEFVKIAEILFTIGERSVIIRGQLNGVLVVCKRTAECFINA